MRLSLVALAAMLVLAGCAKPNDSSTSSSHPQPPAGEATILTTPALTHLAGHNETSLVAVGVTAARMATGHDSGEPTIGVSNAGHIFVTSATFQGINGNPRTDLFRSDDAGATWTDISPLLAGQKTHPITGDPMLYFDAETGRLFDIDQIDIACDYISSSDDNGDTWLPPTDACLYPPSDHQTIMAAKPIMGLPSPIYAKWVYVCMNQIAQTNCERSVDGGVTFQQATPPFQGVEQSGPEGGGQPNICSGLVGHLKTGPAGELYLPRDQCGKPLVAMTDNGAVTWTVTQVSNIQVQGSDPAVAVGPDGTVYYVWQAKEGLLLSTSTDHGATWSHPVQVMAPGLTSANIPALTAGPDDRIALAYYGTGFPGGYEAIQHNATNADNATWNAYLAVISNATTETPSVLTVQLNNATDVLARGNCGPGRCFGVFDFIDVQIDADGRPWVALVDACPAKCDAADGKQKDNSGGAGLIATIATGPSMLDGKPLVPIHGVKA